MFRSIISYIFFVFCMHSVVFAQTTVDKIPLRLDFGDKQAIPVYNEENGELALFINDGNSIYSYLYNEADEMIKSYRFDKTADRQMTDKQAILQQDGKYVIYKSDPLRTSFESHTYDIHNEKKSKHRFDIHLTDEFHLKSIASDEKLYMFTVGKKNNWVYVYEFDSPTHYSKHQFNLSSLTKPYNKTFFEMVRPTKDIGNYGMGNDIMLVHENITTSLKTAGVSKKIYYKDQHFKLSIDQRDEQNTLVFDFDIIQNTCELYRFDMVEKNSNRAFSSYIYEDMVYQINANENGFLIERHAWPDDKLMQSYVFHKNDLHPADHLERNFGKKNNPLERMIKQASRGDAAVVINKNANQDNIMTFGASENGDFKILGFAAAGLAIAGPLGGLAAGSGKHIYYKGDPTVEEFFSLLNYENGIYQEQKMDADYNISTETIPVHPFLKISELIQSLKDIRGKSAFCLYRKKDIYYLGFYDKYEKQFFIVKFDS